MTIQAPRFSPGLSQSDLQRGYQQIGDRPPFTRRDLKQAYKPYELKLNRSRGRASDSRLYKEATRAVLDWYRRQEAEKKKADKQAKRAMNQAANQAAQATARVTGAGSGGIRASTVPTPPRVSPTAPHVNPIVAGAAVGAIGGRAAVRLAPRRSRTGTGVGTGGAQLY